MVAQFMTWILARSRSTK